MRIWHQSFTDLDAFPQYRQTLQDHARRVMGPDVEVRVHGLRPGTYGPGIAPMDVNCHRYLKFLNERQVCEAALAAERAGYSAFALGCFFDPGLHAARSLVDIPVVSLAETCMLVACSLGRKFACISLNDFQRSLTEDLARAYGVGDRLAASLAMSPAVHLFDLERDDAAVEPIKAGFVTACRTALAAGAEVIIPGDGVLNAFLLRQQMLECEGAVVMDSLGVLFQHAAFFARARASTGLTVSRRQFYAKPSAAMLAHTHSFFGCGEAAEGDFSGGNSR